MPLCPLDILHQQGFVFVFFVSISLFSGTTGCSRPTVCFLPQTYNQPFSTEPCFLLLENSIRNQDLCAIVFFSYFFFFFFLVLVLPHPPPAFPLKISGKPSMNSNMANLDEPIKYPFPITFSLLSFFLRPLSARVDPVTHCWAEGYLIKISWEGLFFQNQVKS